MAAQVEVQTAEVGRTVAGGRHHLTPLSDSSNNSLIDIPSVNQPHRLASEPNKPVPSPKPRLTPKPFSVQKNPTIKPILAPKPHTKPRPESTRLAGYKPEVPRNPKPQQSVASSKPRPVSTNPNRPASTSFNSLPMLNTGQTTKPVVQPFKPAPPLDTGDPSRPTPPVPAERQKPSSLAFSKSFKNLPAAEWSGTTTKEDERGQNGQGKGVTSLTRAKSMGFLLQAGQEKEAKEKAQPETSVPLRPHPRGTRPRPVSAIFPVSPSKTEAPLPAPRWTGRRPLSADLTAKFESIGLSQHRNVPEANTKEGPEGKVLPQRKEEEEEDKTLMSTTPQSTDDLCNHQYFDSDQSNKNKEVPMKEANEDKHRVSIKSRISLLLDSPSSPGVAAAGQGSDLRSPVQSTPEIEPPVGVKQLIKQLTEDTTPTQSPVLKPAPKPRPLPLDLTKRFSAERSPDSVFLNEAVDHHDINKHPQKRAEESAITPSDQKTFLDLKGSQEQPKKVPSPEGLEAGQTFGTISKESGAGNGVQMVRASLYDNIVERHSVLMMDEGSFVNTAKDFLSSPSPFKTAETENDGNLVMATYSKPLSPSSPLPVLHAFDTVQAVEESRAVSESIPSAHWEDKAMTLRSRRSEGSRPLAEGTSAAEEQPPLAVMSETQPRYLRIGALQKWTMTGLDQDVDMEKGMLKESQREGQVALDKDRERQRMAEQEDVAAAPKRLKMLQAEEMGKPRATYFALTGQIQETVSFQGAGTNTADMTVLYDDSFGRSLLGGPQGKSLPIMGSPSLDDPSGKIAPSQELLMRSHKPPREMRSALDGQSKEAEKKREQQKEKEKHKTKMKEVEKEKQKQLEIERQAHFEYAQMKMQRQKPFEKEKQEFDEKQYALDRQKQTEFEKAQELEREKQRLEREKQRKLENEKRRELERQREKMQEKERQREKEEQKQKEEELLLELQRQKQKEKEMQLLEKQRLKQKKEKEEEKLRQMALEQEMLRIKELEREREKERQKEIEREKQRELEKRRQRDLERERQRQQDIERRELENQRLRQQELEKERKRKEDIERLKELERLQLLEFEKQKQAERERQQIVELEKQRQLDTERQELENQRLRQQELEKERKRKEDIERLKELERLQLLEFEKQKQAERERQQIVELEKQRQLDTERQELENQRLRQQEQEKERKRKEDIERLKELERLQLLEFEKQKQAERERQQIVELEKQRQQNIERQELENQRLRQQELEKERKRKEDIERLKELETLQLLEYEKQKRAERERQQIMELEKQRQLDTERQELENQRLRQQEQEKERKRKEDIERLKELERLQLLEYEKQKRAERERQQIVELEKQRQLDTERQELENQRLRQQELEKERKRKEDIERLRELEKLQFLEYEKQKQAERKRQQIVELEKRRLREKMEREEAQIKEEADRMRVIAKQQEAERQRLKEKQKKEEQERLKLESSSPLRSKVFDLDSVLRNNPVSRSASQRTDAATRWKEPYKPGILDIDSFTSQAQPSPNKDLFPLSGIQGLNAEFGGQLQPTPESDVSWKMPPQISLGISNPVWTTPPQDPWELRSVEMSVDQPKTESRKYANEHSPELLRPSQEERIPTQQRPFLNESLHLALFPGTEIKSGNTPGGLPSSTHAEQIWLPRELQSQEIRGKAQRRSHGSQELSRLRSRSVSRRSTPAGNAAEGSPFRMRSRSAHREQDLHSWVQQKQSASSEEEGKDSPVHETDSQYGTWETGLRTDDSLTPVTPSSDSNLSPSPRKPTPAHTPGDRASPFESDTLDGLPPSSSPESQPLSFPDAPTTLLDTSVLRSRAQLGKKRAPRTRPTRAARQSAAQAEVEEGTTEDWLYRDSTEAKAESKDDGSDPEEQPKGADAAPAVASQPQRVALFPGMDPSALKAQLKKRGDSDNQIDGPASSPSQLSRSPKSPFLPRAARVLPPSGGKENGEEDSPQWLKELKSKKRLSQYENEI